MILAQISDLHIKPAGHKAYGVADTLLALKSCVSTINRLDPQPDILLVSGDISDDGSLASYKLAADELSKLAIPVYLVPGNHDQKDNMARGFSNHLYLQNRLQTQNDKYICYAINKYPLTILAMDTVTPGLHGGGLDMERLEWLNAELEKSSDKPVLIFMHHPPFPSAIAHMDQEIFQEVEAFSKILRNHPHVLRLTCGHIHRPVFTEFGSHPATVCPGVGMQLALDLHEQAPSNFRLEPPAMMLHILKRDWSDKPSLLSHVMLVDHSDHSFGPSYPFFDVVSPK